MEYATLPERAVVLMGVDSDVGEPVGEGEVVLSMELEGLRAGVGCCLEELATFCCRRFLFLFFCLRSLMVILDCLFGTGEQFQNSGGNNHFSVQS
jgi:hypothetical protein